MSPKILLTDTNRWPVTARLAIAFAKRGCQVAALCPTPEHPVQKVSVVQRVFPYSGYDPLTSLRSAIEKFDPDIVVPSCERGVRHLHELDAISRSKGTSEGTTATLIERSLGSPESFPIVTSRYQLLRIAAAEGILVPDTIAINSAADLKLFIAETGPPWVMKADGTWGGRGVRVASNLAAAEYVFFELAQRAGAPDLIKRLLLNRDRGWILFDWKRSGSVVIAQALIDGRPANCAVVCWRGEVLAAIGVEVIRAQGLKGPATVVRVVENPEMMAAAKRIAQRLKLSGFFGLDFMIENNAGATYLIEMNPRCTPPCPLSLGGGRDLVAAMWAHLTGEPLPESRPVTRKNKIAYFPQAWAHAGNLPDMGSGMDSEADSPDTSYHDIPDAEPELVHELLHPWCERSLLGQMLDRGRRMWKREKTSTICVFEDAAASAGTECAAEDVALGRGPIRGEAGRHPAGENVHNGSKCYTAELLTRPLGRSDLAFRRVWGRIKLRRRSEDTAMNRLR